MSRVALPGANISIQIQNGQIAPVWYDKLKIIEAAINSNAIGDGGLLTTATIGFGYLPTSAGPPTGTPLAKPGYVPAVLDTTNSKLWMYIGGAWKGVVLV